MDDHQQSVSSEELLSQVGNCGPFQGLLFISIAYSVITLAAFSSAIPFFLVAEPRWRCAANSTVCKIPGTFGPGEHYYNYRCSIPRQEWTFVDEYTTFVTQFDLVCNKALTYTTTIITVNAIGSAVGTLLVGVISDRIGRRSALFLSGLTITCGFLFLRFVQTFWLITIPVFLLGAGLFGILFSGLIYIMEYVGIRQRAMVGNLYWSSFGLGFGVFAGIAYLVRDWRTLVLVLGLSGLPGLIISYCLLPESLRWLVVKGHDKQVKKTLQKIAKINKKDIQEEITLPKYEVEKSSHDIRLLFRSGYATYTLVICYSMFVNAMIYTGVFLLAPTIGGNIYLNWFLSGLAEVISSILGAYVHSRFKRKLATGVAQILTALSAFGTAILVYFDNGTTGFLVGKLLLAMVSAKLFSSISLNGLNLINVELYPTFIRNTAHGFNTFWSAISIAASGYVANLVRIDPILPFGIMGITEIIAGVLCFTLLKETSNQPILEIFQENQDDQNSESTRLIDMIDR